MKLRDGVWIWLASCFVPAPFLGNLAYGADFRLSDTKTYSVPIDFRYGMNEVVQGRVDIPTFNNTDGVLERVSFDYHATTFMSWTQQLFQRVPVGTRFAQGRGTLELDLAATNLNLGLEKISNERRIELDCISTTTLGYCAPFINKNAAQFTEGGGAGSNDYYLAQEIGGPMYLQAKNSKLPSSLGDFNGDYRTVGTIDINYTYDATPEAVYAREAYDRALAAYLPGLGAGEKFDQVAFSRILYSKAINLREEFNEYGNQLTQNQVIKRLEYSARGINGALIQAAGLERLGDSGDIANDVANAFITLSAPTYVALKSVGTALGVDYSEQGGGKASVPRAADVGSAYTGFLYGSSGVEAALNKIYDLNLPEQAPLKKVPQPPPDDRQKGVEIPLTLSDNGPIVKSFLWAVNIDNATSPVRFDPPNTGRTLLVAAGLQFASVLLLDPLGTPLDFHLEFGDRQFNVAAGARFYFSEHSNVEGVDAFFVSGINPDVPEFDFSVTFVGAGSALVSSIDVTAVPEPTQVSLLLAGLGMVGWASRRRGLRATEKS